MAGVGIGRLSLKKEVIENILRTERVNWKSDSAESFHHRRSTEGWTFFINRKITLRNNLDFK